MKTELFKGDCIEGLKNLESESVDCVLTDPPYLYLKNQKLEREFNEQEFFVECKRVLKRDGFVILFGRGTSFYRWNSILADLGFNFKEEIIWDKSHSSSPLMSISRVHETISIFSKGKGKINKVKIPYLEMKAHNLDAVIADIKRLKTTFSNAKSMMAVLDFLDNNCVRQDFTEKMSNKQKLRGDARDGDRCVTVLNSIEKGLNEKTIIRTDREVQLAFTKYRITADQRKKGNRAVDVMQGLEKGLNEKTIIKEIRDHYTAIHPTQKPVRLLERLLQLVTKDGYLVVDPFAGSFSTAEACINLGLSFKGWEIDEEYFLRGKQRIDDVLKEKALKDRQLIYEN